MRQETKCIQAGYNPGNGDPRMIPIIQSTTFKYDTSEDMGKLFDLEASGDFYSRLQNPTSDYVAAKICALEGGSAAMLTSSGQAANLFAVFNLAQAGEGMLFLLHLYTEEHTTCLTLPCGKWELILPLWIRTALKRN